MCLPLGVGVKNVKGIKGVKWQLEAFVRRDEYFLQRWFLCEIAPLSKGCLSICQASLLFQIRRAFPLLHGLYHNPPMFFIQGRCFHGRWHFHPNTFIYSRKWVANKIFPIKVITKRRPTWGGDTGWWSIWGHHFSTLMLHHPFYDSISQLAGSGNFIFKTFHSFLISSSFF